MSDIIINKEVSVLDGDSLNLVLKQLLNSVDSLFLQNEQKDFTSWDSLNLTEASANLKDIHLNLPINSMFVIDIAQAVSGSVLPCPYINQVSSPSYQSGLLTAKKGSDRTKTQFDYMTEIFRFRATMNESVSSNVLPWQITSQNSIVNTGFPNATSWGRLISNIWVPGVYYFTSAQMALFTDAPTGQGSFIEVRNAAGLSTQNGSTGTDRQYIVTENISTGQAWRRTNTGAWKTVT